MTLEREGRTGPFIIECDICKETYECEHEEFADALADARSEGWYAINRSGEWKHYCCQPCAREDDP